MKEIIQLLEKEINSKKFQIEHTAARDSELIRKGELMGLERAVEIVRSINIADDDYAQLLNMDLWTGSLEKEYALIGMSKVENGYAVTCTEFGDEKDGNTQFQAIVSLTGDRASESLFK
jgi:hypothetical protein